MITLNRVSQLMSKVIFVSRQRHAVNFSRRFVISDKDIQAASHTPAVIPEVIRQAAFVEELDPEGNKIDRRLLYQITGLQLHKDEINDSASELSENSDSDDEVGMQDAFGQALTSPEDLPDSTLLSVNN